MGHRLASATAMYSATACTVVMMLLSCGKAHAQLSPESYYEHTCPDALAVVQRVVGQAMERERRVGASLLRLHFHDCAVNGCDGSVLLDDTPMFTGEKTADRNHNSVRGFNVVDQIKEELESVCSGTVSCADIVAIAARDSVFLSGGPTWKVQLGRRDGTTASKAKANTALPQITTTGDLPICVWGLSEHDMVTLAGAHTIGRARCTEFSARLYNHHGTGRADPSLPQSYLSQLQHLCPQNGDGNTTTSLDDTQFIFDNQYYKNLQDGRGLLNSDQALFTTSGESLALVNLYANDEEAFFRNFATSMLKMGNIGVITGSQGQIRTNCRKINSGSY